MEKNGKGDLITKYNIKGVFELLIIVKVKYCMNQRILYVNIFYINIFMFKEMV